MTPPPSSVIAFQVFLNIFWFLGFLAREIGERKGDGLFYRMYLYMRSGCGVHTGTNNTWTGLRCFFLLRVVPVPGLLIVFFLQEILRCAHTRKGNTKKERDVVTMLYSCGCAAPGRLSSMTHMACAMTHMSRHRKRRRCSAARARSLSLSFFLRLFVCLRV